MFKIFVISNILVMVKEQKWHVDPLSWACQSFGRRLNVNPSGVRWDAGDLSFDEQPLTVLLGVCGEKKMVMEGCL
jgi:hypothetical protein